MSNPTTPRRNTRDSTQTKTRRSLAKTPLHSLTKKGGNILAKEAEDLRQEIKKEKRDNEMLEGQIADITKEMDETKETVKSQDTKINLLEKELADEYVASQKLKKDLDEQKRKVEALSAAIVDMRDEHAATVSKTNEEHSAAVGKLLEELGRVQIGNFIATAQGEQCIDASWVVINHKDAIPELVDAYATIDALEAKLDSSEDYADNLLCKYVKLKYRLEMLEGIINNFCSK